MDTDQIKLISDALHELAHTLALVAIINALDKAMSPEERYILCKSLSDLLNSVASQRLEGSQDNAYRQERMFF